MQCPLCAGPLRITNPARFVCERDHEFGGEELQREAATRVTVAFWMAIEALQTEADALRALGAAEGPLAEQADKDAKVLRQLAMARIHQRDDQDQDQAAG